jgi:GntR family transcriptional regulator, transcriptional repressor for pyruvate dehydrogenase complex
MPRGVEYSYRKFFKKANKVHMSTLLGGRSRNRSLGLDLVDLIERRVKDGVYPLGTRMPTEAELMAEHGVSRTVVREAISRLQQAGLVVTKHGIGSFVTESMPVGAGFNITTSDVATIVDVIHVLELRISVETECAGLAALRRTEREIIDMKLLLDEFDVRANQSEQTVDTDFKFHMAIAEATKNPHFVELMRHLGTTLIPRARVNSVQIAMEDRSSYLQRVNLEHRGILNAIESRDSESARASMRVHLTNSRERLRKATGEGS